MQVYAERLLHKDRHDKCPKVDPLGLGETEGKDKCGLEHWEWYEGSLR